MQKDQLVEILFLLYISKSRICKLSAKCDCCDSTMNNDIAIIRKATEIIKKTSAKSCKPTNQKKIVIRLKRKDILEKVCIHFNNFSLPDNI